jgi:acetyl esterase/lipase
VGVIVLGVKKQKEKIITKEISANNEEAQLQQFFNYITNKAGYIESWNELYGQNISNIEYAKNGKIENSFKKGGANYKDEIGEINGGKDYEKNERNIYDLYIPYSTEFTKNKHNGIILFIHGGSWTSGDKGGMEYLTRRYAKYGYITATLSYTLLLENYTDSNIFKMLDEITACIQSIKDELISRNFDADKLELALGGTSSGAHVALLYTYSMKNSPIPIKFVIDIVGPVSLEPKCWYKPIDFNNPLDTLSPESIQKGKDENKIQKVYDDIILLALMNAFLGRKYTQEEVLGIIENGTIKETDSKYQEMLNRVKYAFPVTYVNANTVPTLCQYGGKDFIAGIGHYSCLYSAFKKVGIQDKTKFIYMKYGGHELINFDTDNGLKAMRDLNYDILDFSKTYFTHDS